MEIAESIIKQRTEKIRSVLREKGACCTGFADISGLRQPITNKYPFAVCFALRYDDEIVNLLPDNDEPWTKMADSLTEKAGLIYRAVQELLDNWGYHYSRVPSSTKIDELPEPGEELPQKTLATLSGLGWIGKSTLLITPEFGPRIRPATLLTDIPLVAAVPVIQSRCGDCRACVDACPVGAIRGNLWSQGTPRSELFDVSRCFSYRWIKKTELGRRLECGACLKVCPAGQKKRGTELQRGFTPL
jgi:epoxyqueuosine reductase